MSLEEIKNKLIKKIKNKYNIDVSEQIWIKNNNIICQNNKFNFGVIFIVYDRQKKLYYYNKDHIYEGYSSNQYTIFGTDEDNNMIIPNEYVEILAGCYGRFRESDDQFIIFLQ